MPRPIYALATLIIIAAGRASTVSGRGLLLPPYLTANTETGAS
ncbi:MAG: hypothetical protein OSA84_01430 [Akkermansiaceae bacterium]|nr:hypothetical protein [Akkermansiaceae bacterium]